MPAVIVFLLASIGTVALIAALYILLDGVIRGTEFVSQQLAIRRAKKAMKEQQRQIRAQGLPGYTPNQTCADGIVRANPTYPDGVIQQGETFGGNVFALRCTRAPHHTGPCNGTPRGDCTNGR